MAALLLLPLLGCGSKPDSSPPPIASSQVEAEVPADTPPPPPLNRDREILRVEQMLERSDFSGAEVRLRALLLANPDDVEVIFRLATVIGGRGDLSAAIELLDSVPDDHPEAGIPALGQSADWCFQLQRYAEAERRYKRVLELFPQTPEAHRKLAYLFNRQGRRHEAATHIYQLCKQGNVRQDELHALIHLSDAMFDDPSSRAQAGERLYLPIGPGARARKLFMEERYQQAAIELHESVASGNQPPSMVALYGRAAVEAQDEKRVEWWLTRTNDETKQFAEYWAAVGTHLLSRSRLQEAARALLEAVDRDPTDFRSIGRLRSVMEALGRNEQAQRWENRWTKLRDISDENNRIADATSPNAPAMRKLGDMLDSLGRTLEGVLWKSIAGMHEKLPRESMLEFNTTMQQLVRSGQGLPARSQRLCEIDPNEFPLPEFDVPQDRGGIALATLGESTPSGSKPHPAGFVNIADEVGLRHAYQVAAEPRNAGFTVYQSVGGAVAVIDYDLDGYADLYFAQGGADPPDFVGTQSNQLYRSIAGQLTDVSNLAQAGEYRYSTGATAGDWNQDGFADLLVANIGANALLLNNGDGTFSRSVLDDRDDKTLMTTSLAMADLSGDALPDLFELNYLHDPDIARRPKINDRGEVVESLKPLDFRPGLDRMIVNDGCGQATFHPVSDAPEAARAGLGIVVSDFDPSPGNEIFVGNDVYANQLWVRAADGGWSDVAMLKGCAFGFNGAKTASMGVAAGDYDRNGLLDFHVTNFQDESVSFFLNRDGVFQDRNIQFGLSDPSIAVLGFGTQAIDYDNDGNLDLVVANGHIENAITMKGSFKQPPQLFCNLRERFQLIGVDDPSGYWTDNHLGRGLARLDFNRDGKMDFAVTHLGETSALMLNQTVTNHHWLQLVLVGVDSERDAIGAKVRIEVGSQQLTEWVTAGDGFLCRNEAVVAFGLGGADAAERITIEWPSGHLQTIGGVEADQRLLVIENEDEPFPQ